MSYDKNVQGGDWAPADNWVPAKDWAPATELSYLGNFKARGESRSGDLTWADTDPPVELSVSAKRPEDLKLGSVIGYATEMDKDIDGGLLNKNAIKAGKKEASSAVKEGEEKFIYGAAYSGLQGISISDSTGLVAAYTRGAKVDWMKGNKWTYQEGGWVVSDVNVSSSKSTTNVENEYKVEVNSKSSSVSNITQGDSSSLTQVGGSLSRPSTVGRDMITTNMVESGIVTANMAGLGTVTTNISGLGIVTANIVGSISTTINAAVAAVATINASYWVCLITKATKKITLDFVDEAVVLAATKTTNLGKYGITVSDKEVEQVEVKIEISGETVKKSNLDVSKTGTLSRNVNNEVQEVEVSVSVGGSKLESNDSSVSNNKFETRSADCLVQNIATSSHSAELLILN